MVQVTAVLVLAAGDSGRMGSPKALLRIGSQTFLEAVVAKVREAELPSPVVAVSRELCKIIDINALDIAAITVHEEQRRNGPIESMRAWLRSEFNQMVDRLLIWPVDQPHVKTSTILSILRHSDAGPGRSIVVPEFEGRRGHPVIFRQAVFGELLSPTADGGAKAVVRRDPSRVLVVPVDDRAVTEDIDTPDDYKTLISSTESLL